MRDPLASLAAIAPDVWLVGGAVRDELLGRETADYDVVFAAEDEGMVGEVARALARAENSCRPAYTASAPFSIAAKKDSSEPAGARSSGLLCTVFIHFLVSISKLPQTESAPNGALTP